jgi:hypothetical protein
VSDHIWYHPLEGKWYFLDESEFEHGPYETRAEAEAALDDYVKWLEGGE